MIRPDDLVKAAPLGSRINFNVSAGGAFNFENVVKIKMTPLTYTAHGREGGNVFKNDELVKKLASIVRPGFSNWTYNIVSKFIWVKEVSIFQDLMSRHTIVYHDYRDRESAR